MFEESEKLKDFLYSIEEFYQPENPQLKDGIGHEVEHIKGVVRRSNMVCDTINQNQHVYGDTADKRIAVTIACLHDIGNVISRKHHNFLGEGILSGRLTAKHIVSNLISDYTKYERNTMTNFVDALEYDGLNFDEVPVKYRVPIVKAYVTVAKFHMSVYGYKDKPVTADNIDDFLCSVIPNEDIRDSVKKNLIDVKSNEFKNLDAQFNPKIKNITKMFNKVFENDFFNKKRVLAGVREHNVDYEMKGKKIRKKFVSQHIYSRIIADADKDNVAETFAIRTMLFAKNHFGILKQQFVKVENGENVVDKDKCILHVLHQARERFGFSQNEWYNLTGINEVQPIFKEAVIEFDCDNGYKSIKELKCYDTISGALSINKGDDIFSQVDTYAKNNGHDINLIIGLRQTALNKCRDWSRVDRREESLKECEQIYAVVENSKTIEQATDFFESQFYEKADMSFKAAIDEAFEDCSSVPLNKRNVLRMDTKNEINEFFGFADVPSIEKTFSQNSDMQSKSFKKDKDELCLV